MKDFSPGWVDRVIDQLCPTPLHIVQAVALPMSAPATSSGGWVISIGLATLLIGGVLFWRYGGSMNGSKFPMAVSFGTDFIISAGGALVSAMVATGNAAMPSVAVMIFAVVTGLIAASRALKASLEPPPTTTKTTETTPTPMGPKTVATETTTTQPVPVPAPVPGAGEATSEGHWEGPATAPVWVAKK